MIKVTLTKSLIASSPKQKANAISLGLKNIGDSIEAQDTPALRGKLKVLAHLIKVENV
ncbi:MAG: 50S ribosomal protein L30 [Clostridia bacterium]|nr:50S ribosomal protein L30 [Clostridia bacterium]